MNRKRSWYLIYTKPWQENLARENLDRQGFVTYLPLAEQTYRRNGQYIKTIEAFFPRYLFINLDSETDNWAPIRSTVGVNKMICFDGIPAVVPDEFIEQLRSNEDESGIKMNVAEKLKPGDTVTIIDGPFAGYKGIYQQQKSKQRVVMLLNIVSNNAELTLSIHDLHIA